MNSYDSYNRPGISADSGLCNFSDDDSPSCEDLTDSCTRCFVRSPSPSSQLHWALATERCARRARCRDSKETNLQARRTSQKFMEYAGIATSLEKNTPTFISIQLFLPVSIEVFGCLSTIVLLKFESLHSELDSWHGTWEGVSTAEGAVTGRSEASSR